MDAAFYIAAELSSPDTVENFLATLDEQIGKLCSHPYCHAVYPTLYATKQEISFFPIKNYLKFYAVMK